ncbi:MAG: hypothetical protein AAFZ49_12770 [Cyanobacteria bacterium J06659_2]
MIINNRWRSPKSFIEEPLSQGVSSVSKGITRHLMTMANWIKRSQRFGLPSVNRYTPLFQPYFFESYLLTDPSDLDYY